MGREEEALGCMDITIQPLKGEMQQSPCNDFTSAVTLFDPDTPSPLSLLVPIGQLRTTLAKGRTEWTERPKGRSEKDVLFRWGSTTRNSHAKGQMLVRVFFLLGVQEGGSGNGSMH